MFRDEDELIPGQDLPGRIRNGLEQSRFLIVMASPAAAKGEWVEKEILDFMAMGKGDRVLVLAIEGEPNAVRKGKAPAEECLPRPFRVRFDANRQPTDDLAPEPLWLDWRGANKRDRLAFLRLVAALLELDRFDDLIQRDTQAERRRLRVWSYGIGLVAAAVLALGALTWIQALMNTRNLGLAFAQLARQADSAGNSESAIRWGLMGMRTGPGEILGVDEPRARSEVVGSLHRQRLKQMFKGHKGDVKSVAFSPDGTRIVTGSEDDTARVWDAKTGDVLLTLKHGYDVTSVAF